MTTMTLRVYRVRRADGAVTPVSGPRTYRADDLAPDIASSVWSLCGCPRCEAKRPPAEPSWT
ncbi:hypothetical protein [Streptomyces kanasensis]|uniref:hypothetical protein n=1 Tax=Streptomyces kanasensis TaxID=936756 RepID=UPI0037F57632